MNSKKPTIAIVGVGLIGGSFALALKSAGAVEAVLGYDLDGENLKQALELGVIDRALASVDELVEADLVMLAVPVKAMHSAARECIPSMKEGAVLTDCGSVKAEVVDSLRPLLENVTYVPGHPIAGTEKSGAGAAFDSLFHDRHCIVTPIPESSERGIELVSALWRSAGCDVVSMDVEKHDRIFAAVSHLPHMVAYALVNSVGAYDRYNENLLEYSAGGFRDFTRIASSHPIMWRDIALANRDALVEMMEHYLKYYGELLEMVRSGDEDALLEFFVRSKNNRDALLEK